jgi:hypothetical protein
MGRFQLTRDCWSISRNSASDESTTRTWKGNSRTAVYLGKRIRMIQAPKPNSQQAATKASTMRIMKSLTLTLVRDSGPFHRVFCNKRPERTHGSVRSRIFHYATCMYYDGKLMSFRSMVLLKATMSIDSSCRGISSFAPPLAPS